MSLPNKDQVNAISKEIAKLEERIKNLSVIRLVLLVILLIGGFLTWEFGVLAVTGLLTLIVIAFVFTSFQETKLRNKVTLNLKRREVFEHEIKLFERDFEGLPEGKEFIIPRHNYSHDLDVFGYKSLFQFINRTSTFKGTQILGKWLNAPLTNSDKIINKQKAVKEIASKTTWAYEFMAFGKSSNEKTNTQQIIDNWLSDKSIFGSPIIKIVRFVFPLITIGIGVCSFTDLIPTFWFTTAFLTQLGLSARFASRISKTQSKLGSRFAIIENYINIVNAIETEKFESEYLKKQQLMFLKNDNGKPVSQNLIQLKKLLDKLDARLNIYLAIVLNGLFLWDINITIQIEKWKLENKENLNQWMHAVGEFDALASLGLFAANHPDYCYPTINSDKSIKFKNFGHPLILDDQLVKNNYSISGDAKVDLLTGANMAGKSTFLRSIGVNLILARIGAPICADEFSFTPFKLFTSLRTVDSLKDNESFFYAELKRLKQLIELYKEGEQIFFLLDEILKGTNSADQHKGSVGLIKNLIEMKASGIIATHDIELATMENQYPESVRNLCFEIEILNDQLKFDYTVKPGFCKTMNASFLMENMGIISSKTKAERV